MSNLQTAKEWHEAIESSKDKFTESNLDFFQEQIFATQLLMNNTYLLGVAKKNQTSLRLAMYNVAAVGLSLNPNQGLAYLIPRRLSKDEEPRVMLDISYRGLITIGVETGAIVWAKAELVHKNDEFIYKGLAEKPAHNFDPFSTDRGELRGGYCIAELPTGGVLVEAMSKADMDKIKNSSEAFKKGVGPWVNWESQMQLKSIVKRASKWWPQSTPRMAKALQLLNEENGEGLALLSNDTATVVSLLPSPPKREEVPIATQNTVKQLVDRAVSQGAFEACREYMGSRIKDPSELSFAYSELDKAKAESETQNQARVINS